MKRVSESVIMFAGVVGLFLDSPMHEFDMPPPPIVCIFQAHTVWRFAMMVLQYPRVHSMLPSLKAVIQLVFVCMVLA